MKDDNAILTLSLVWKQASQFTENDLEQLIFHVFSQVAFLVFPFRQVIEIPANIF